MKKSLLVLVAMLLLCLSPSTVWAFDETEGDAKMAWSHAPYPAPWEAPSDVAFSFSLESFKYYVPITGRDFYNVIPDSRLNELGTERYRSFLRSARVSSDAKRTAQVNRVASRLAKAAEELCANEGVDCDFHWEFKLVQDKEINAWCMPGGKIVVYDGIMPVANDDASLAIVLGHEIAHAIAKHSAEQMTKGLISAAGVAALYVIINNSDMSEKKKDLAKLMASAGLTLATLKFSRIDEAEADRIGLILAAMAGYDPEVAVDFWQRMGKATNNTGKRDWYSTHPSNQNRIENIRSYLPEALEYYHK